MNKSRLQLRGFELAENFDFAQLELEQPESRPSYNLVLEKGEDGWVLAHCNELHVHTQGKTQEEAIKNAVEAIQLMLDSDKEFSITIRHTFRV